MHKFGTAHRPLWIGSGIAVVAILLVPAAYLAGWLGDLSQVKPILSSLQKAHQSIAWQESRLPQEPPLKSPNLSVQRTGSAITLRWPSIPKASTYDIYRSPQGLSFSEATNIGEVSQHTSTISYTDTTVQPGSQYTYWVAALNGAGEGPVSSPTTVQVYDSWHMIAKKALSATAWATATASKSTAWGLLGTSRTSIKEPVFNIDQSFISPYQFPGQANASSFLTRRTTAWHLGQSTVTAYSYKGFSILSGNNETLSSLQSGTSTSNELVVFESSGHMTTAIIAAGTSPVPDNALVMNQFGQAVGISNDVGTIIPITHHLQIP